LGDGSFSNVILVMMIRELIEKFYSGKCSEEEKQEIIDWFRENPVALENYFSESEWRDFVYSEQLDSQVSDSLLKEILKTTQRKTTVISLFKKVAVAASVALLIGIGWKYFFGNKIENPAIASAKPLLIDTLNSGNETIALMLPDSSLVYLFPDSRLRYSFFDNNKRDVYLTGEASFAVTKNPSKPFTVYSGTLSTTALGTKFIVTAFTDSNFIKVKLMEGKVVIKPADGNYTKLKKDHYLMPGEEFEWNKREVTAVVKKKEKEHNKEEPSAEGKITTASNWYMFNNQSMAQVLDQLSSIYHVHIRYNQEDIRKINFIGRIEKTDSIQTILNDIALLNNLVVTRQGNTYSIRKK
jgi:transmembrane sensor